MTRHISQLRLRHDASLRTLLGMFRDGAQDALNRRHQLLWSAFSPEAGDTSARDFLWRSTSGDRFIAISARKPQGNDLLEVERCTEFDPSFAARQVLRFSLRASAVKSTMVCDADGRRQGRGKKHCLIGSARAAGIDPAEATKAWFARQGEERGFEIADRFSLDHSGTETVRPGIRQGVFEISGQLRVTDPERLKACLGEGIGRLKAFGCGMLILGG